LAWFLTNLLDLLAKVKATLRKKCIIYNEFIHKNMTRPLKNQAS